ncbi:MAG: hypothetical protein RJA70_3376 [Pseudomonadota bacterium]
MGSELGFQTRTLIASAASPDPFGREVPLLDDWYTATPFLVWHVAPELSLAAQQPVTLSQSASGVEAVSSIDAPAIPIAAGDTVLSALFSHPLNFGATALTLMVAQRATVPTGHESSFLKEDGMSYSPSLGLHWQLTSLTFAAIGGLHLRRSVSFGDLRFGSEALFGAGVAYSRWNASLSTELQLRPALQSDESAAGATIHRFPAALLFNLGYPFGPVHAAIGVGSSLPVSVTQKGATSDRVSGPPGSVFRMSATLAYSFR